MELLKTLKDNWIIALVVVIILLLVTAWLMGWLKLGGEGFVMEVGSDDLQNMLYNTGS